MLSAFLCVFDEEEEDDPFIVSAKSKTHSKYYMYTV